MSPAVSVLIPVYLGETLIGRTLDSLLAQTFTGFEVLCIGDHSPDGSAAVIKAWAERDRRIRYLKTPANQGIVSKVINAVREEVRGRWFVYSSQDDFFSADWLEKMVAAIERSGADAAVPNLEFIAEDGHVLRRLSGWDRFGTDVISGLEAFELSLDWTIPTNALWKTALLREHGYFDFGLYADEYTGRFFFLECDRVAFCDATFHYFHGNLQSITKKVSAGRLDVAYNEYRMWELVHERLPGSAWAARYARQAARSVLECAVMIAQHPHLAQQRHRLDPALEGMRSPAYRDDLRRAFTPRQWPKRIAAFALLRSAAVRALAGRVIASVRRAKISSWERIDTGPR